MPTSRFLQLLPLDVGPDAGHLADDALAAAPRPARRIIIRRPLTQMRELASIGFHGATTLHVIGSAALVCLASVFMPSKRAGSSTLRRRIIYTPSAGAVPLREARLLSLLAGRCEFLTVSPSETVRHQAAFVFRRLSAQHLAIRPSRNLPLARAGRDDAVRQDLGVFPREQIVFAPGDAVLGSGHELALWSTSILDFARVGGLPWRLLITGHGPRVSRLIHFDRNQGGRALIIAHDQSPRLTPEQLLAASDIVLCLGDRTSPIRPAYEARAVGVPLLTTPHSPAAEIAEPAQVVAPNSRAIARRMLDLSPGDSGSGTPLTGLLEQLDSTAPATWRSLLAEGIPSRQPLSA